MISLKKAVFVITFAFVVSSAFATIQIINQVNYTGICFLISYDGHEWFGPNCNMGSAIIPRPDQNDFYITYCSVYGSSCHIVVKYLPNQSSYNGFNFIKFTNVHEDNTIYTITSAEDGQPTGNLIPIKITGKVFSK